jgi:hypothetical protein
MDYTDEDMGRFEAAIRTIDADWPHYKNDEGECYCYYCGHLLANGPNSPFPHEPVCPLTAIRQIVAIRDEELEAGVD